MSNWQELSSTDEKGNNIQVIGIKEQFDYPIWSNDGKILFGLSGGLGSYDGYPAYWDLEIGRFKICDRNLPNFSQIQSANDEGNRYQVIVHDAWEIQIFDIAKCKYVQKLVDYSDNPGRYSLAGFSYFPSTNMLVYGLVVKAESNQAYKLISFDLKNGVRIEIAEGINPTWSPDGTKIAYLGLDGLYVISEGGHVSSQIISGSIFDAQASGSPWALAPIPQWSPDGQWLVYHRCIKEKYCMMGEASLYKVQISDGIEEKLLDGGEYPSWKPELNE
jgi:Tol biopolymer transport system component